MSDRISHLFKNSFIFLIGNLGTKLISFLMVPFFTYYLSTSQFGTVDLITNTVAMLTPIVSLSIFDAVFRFVMDAEEDPKSLYTNGLIISVIGMVMSELLSICISPLLSFNFGLEFGVLLGLSALNSFFLNFVRGIGKVKLFAFAGFLFAALNALLNIIFVMLLHLGVEGVLLASILGSLISILIVMVFGKTHLYFKLKLASKAEIKKMIHFSLPLIPNAFAWWFTTDASRFFILYFVGTQGNGFYAVANKIPTILTIVFSVFSQAWQISAVQSFEESDRSKFYSVVFNSLMSCLFVGVAVLTFFSQTIMHWLVAPDFFEAWKLTPFLLLAMMFSNLSGFLGTTYIAAKKTAAIFWTTIVGMVLNGVFNLIFIPMFGVDGAGIGSSVGFLVVMLIRLYNTKKIIGINMKWFDFFGNISLFLLLVYLVRFSNLSAFYSLSVLLIIIAINGRGMYPMLKKIRHRS